MAANRIVWVVAAVLALLFGLRSIAGWIIDYQWWKELGQLPAWWSLLAYTVSPLAGITVLCFAAIWTAHARALKAAGTRLREHKIYARVSTLVILLVAVLTAMAASDSWTVVRYFGGRDLSGAAIAWRDPMFGNPLSFYFFELPFYRMLLGVALAVCFLTVLTYWLGSKLWRLSRTINWHSQVELSLEDLRLTEGLDSKFLRGAAAVYLAGYAMKIWLGRYEMLYDDHVFLVGVDYVSENIRLPLVWMEVGAVLAAGALILARRFRLALAMALVIPVEIVVPKLVNTLYVRPTENSLQRPYVDRHIQATRSAFGLGRRSREAEVPMRLEAPIDTARHRALLENVRLWDWRPFHDTVAQIQPLRPYIFENTDIDRYTIDGRLRQVLLTPREMDLRQLGDARARWINPHFIYTHGYGIVMAEAGRITADGLPHLFVKDAPPQVITPSLKLTRPEIYYGELPHAPVFVSTAQMEFNYPSGSENVHNRYDGKGGFPIASLPLKVIAALREGDWNILLTTYLTGQSRMMIRRKVTERVETLAGFLEWDDDPYLVVSENGRLVWMIDGYTTSAAHPYSRRAQLGRGRAFNYIRNSVKATVDAYDGTTRLYVFDSEDPVILAYQRLFPGLLAPASEMPADLRAHARYPERLFRVQAEMYLTYHMQDPEAFYNKVDVWDIARGASGQGAKPEQRPPIYLIARLPGEEKPEFLLMTYFTPRAKDNLIGLMAARCDGEHLGELVFLQMPKQELVFGPMQIEARINQDQNISKDLTLWNQQGSQVIRGEMMVLPIENTFLYIQPIYIQASEARMPQLKKIAMAMGNRLIYTDTYDQALAELSGIKVPVRAPEQAASPAAPSAAQAGTPSDPRIDEIRRALKRYRELAAQGKWSEAGKQLEMVETLLGR